ncbi:MAG: hypothetical protein H3C34_21275 [Caldilineaceae bacterium]|nr:hypothetical protein [Caldilineaceae bacterium]
MKQSEIEQLLPEIFRRAVVEGSPLSALLDVMEALHAPSEAILSEIDRYFDPYRTPDAFVPYLASWLDLERLLARAPATMNAQTAQTLFPGGLGRLRDLTAMAVYLSKWRGTTVGLTRFLETATGVRGFVIEEQVMDESGSPKPFHIRVNAPKEAASYASLIARIVEQEKPAYVTHEVIFAAD